MQRGQMRRAVALALVTLVSGCASVPPAAPDRPATTSGRELFDAAFRGNTDAVKALLARQADVNWRNVAGWTPVMMAAAERHLDTVAVLLAAGADPNLRNQHGRTALMFAASYGQTAIVQRLLASGADPNVVPTDESGWSALLAAAARGHATVVGVLLQAGADAAVKARNGQTALELAREGGHRDVIDLLRAPRP